MYLLIITNTFTHVCVIISDVVVRNSTTHLIIFEDLATNSFPNLIKIEVCSYKLIHIPYQS